MRTLQDQVKEAYVGTHAGWAPVGVPPLSALGGSQYDFLLSFARALLFIAARDAKLEEQVKDTPHATDEPITLKDQLGNDALADSIVGAAWDAVVGTPSLAQNLLATAPALTWENKSSSFRAFMTAVCRGAAKALAGISTMQAAANSKDDRCVVFRQELPTLTITEVQGIPFAYDPKTGEVLYYRKRV